MYHNVEVPKGSVYTSSLVKDDDGHLYESLDALLLEINTYPNNFGIEDEIVSIQTGGHYDPTDTKLHWRYNEHDVVVYTVCNAGDPDYCGAIYEDEWYCGWHESYRTDAKSVDYVVIV